MRRAIRPALSNDSQEVPRRAAIPLADSWNVLLLSDNRGKISYVTSSVNPILGYAPDDLAGRTVFDLAHPDEAAALLSILEQLLDNPDCDKTAEFRMRHADGSWCWVEGRWSNLLENPEVGAIAVNIHDVSKRKRLEEELEEANNCVADAKRRKDEFLAILAHEFRNPLGPVLNGLHVIKQLERADTTIAKVREIMERQVQHLARLVDDLLDIARITHGQIELRPEPLDMNSAVQKAAEKVRPQLEARGQELKIEAATVPVHLCADPTRLQQILENLLSNVSKYAGAGARIEVNTERQEDEAVVRVRDTSGSVTPEQLAQIFEPFQQLSLPGNEAEGDLGIGLNLVQQLVEAHRGSIEARSSGPGLGNEFIMRLPAISQELASEQAGKGNAPPVAPYAKRRVLVVDDNRDAAKSLAMVLRLEGHEVQIATDGARALEKAEEDRPEVIFLDIGMPGLDGYEVAKRLRKQFATQNSLLVALTGFSEDVDQHRSREAGFDYYLVKPVEPHEIKSLLADPGLKKNVP